MELLKNYATATIVTVLALASVFYGQAAPGESGMRPMMVSNKKAFEVVELAVSASGGLDRLENLSAVALNYKGLTAATFQGPDPGSPHRMLPREGSVAFDVANGRVYASDVTRWPNFTSETRAVFKDGKTYALNDANKQYSVSDDQELLRAWVLRIAPLALRELFRNRQSLSYLGRVQDSVRTLEVISGVLDDGHLYRFYFSGKTGLPEMIERLDYRSDFGDMTVRLTFSAYQSISGLVMPLEVSMSFDGDVIYSYSLSDVALGRSADVSMTTLPPGYKPAPAGKRVVSQTSEIARNVFLIRNLAGRDYNVMFADLGEYLVVFEAPIDMWASSMALSEIRKLFPDKPVRYVMLTHFHDDHAAGVRTYMAEGATVVTTPGNAEYFQKVARTEHDFHSANSGLKVANPKLEIVGDRPTDLMGESLTVRFLRLGETPHAKENLVALIPEHGIIFQGDLFRAPEGPENEEALRDEGLLLYNAIESGTLRPNRIVGVHGPIASVSDLERAFKLRGQEKSPRP